MGKEVSTSPAPAMCAHVDQAPSTTEQTEGLSLIFVSIYPCCLSGSHPLEPLALASLLFFLAFEKNSQSTYGVQSAYIRCPKPIKIVAR